MERIAPIRLKAEKPKDVRLAEFTRNLDAAQVAAGIALFPFLPAIGMGLIAWNGVSFVGTEAYIKARMNSERQKSVSVLGTRSAPREINFRQSELALAA